jgi:pre-mRNA-splicing factor 38A
MTHQADAKRALDDRGYTGHLIHNDNPLKLLPKPVRDRITDSYYWKEQCFGLNAATLLDRALELTYIGGTHGAAQKPSPFLCLAFKLLQLTPAKDIILFYLGLAGEEFKYLRALAAFYVRLTWEVDEEVYTTLEPLLSDKRKLRRRMREGWRVTFVDEFVDELLMGSRVCATPLPKIHPRAFLEDEDRLEERVSALGEELDELDREGDGDDEEEGRLGSGSDEGEVEEIHVRDLEIRNGFRRGSGSSREEGSEDARRGSNNDEMDDGD